MVSQPTNVPRPFKVTIIYMVEERTKEKIDHLCEQLRACGIEIFMFRENMPAIEDHAAEMEEKIKHTDSVIICYSENFEKGIRGYRNKEVRAALDEQKMRKIGNTYLIIVRLDECPVPSYLSTPRVLDYLGRDHFDGIMRWGLAEQRKQLIEGGENIQEFNYLLSQKKEARQYSAPSTQHVQEKKKSVGLDPFPPVWNIPYRYAGFFTGRDHIVAEIFKNFTAISAAPGIIPVQALTGLGGLGKTQTAVAYAFRYRKEYQTVLWVKAETKRDLITSFTNIAKLLALPGTNLQQRESVLDSIQRWFRNTTKWLLILDNADNLTVVEPFLPRATNGHVLLTSRTTAIGDLAQPLALAPLEPNDGALCILRRANAIPWSAPLSAASPVSAKAARELSQLMDGLPLALEQAGAYIETTGRGVSGYLELYQQYRPEIQLHQYGEIPNYRQAVAFAWNIAREAVQIENPAAIELLHLCAFLAPDAIPYKRFPKDTHILGSTLGPVAANPLRLDQAISLLRKHSLVKNEVDHETDIPRIFIHRVLQEILRDGMDPSTQRLWAERAVRIVALALSLEEWQIMQAHVQSCLSLIDHWKMNFREVDLIRQYVAADQR